MITLERSRSDQPFPDPHMQTSVKVVGSIAALEPFIPQWEDLAEHASWPNVFYAPWVLMPMLRHLNGPGPCRFVLVFGQAGDDPRSQRLIGFFPLQNSLLHPFLPVGRLQMWHSELTFRCMPLVRAGYEDACIGAFLAWFHKGPGWYNVLDMELLPTGNRLHDAIVRHLGAASGLDWVEKRQESHIYECSSDFETYLSTNVSKEGRAALRRKHRNLAKLGPVEIIERGQADDMAAVADLFLRLEASGWKGKAGTAMASVPGQSETFRKLLTGGGEKGRVSVTELRVGGQPVAMLVTFLAAPGSFAFKIAYDQNHPAARQSPGVLLVTEAVRQMHEDGSLLGAGIHWCDSCAAADSELALRLRTRALPLRCYRVAARHGFAALPILLQRLRAVMRRRASGC